MRPVILFVDDEPHLLSGLRRNLRSMRDRWDMQFAEGGRQALEFADTHAIDVIVSDMRMPGMDGAELLTTIAERLPRTIRFVLSGQAEEEDAFRLIGISHQFHSKPCDTESLIDTIERALLFRNAVPDEAVQTRVAKAQILPCLGANLDALVAEAGAAAPSLERLARIISGDIALAVRLLQIAGSGYFRIGDAHPGFVQTAVMLGPDRITRIVSDASVFTSHIDSGPEPDSLSRLTAHSIACSRTARGIAAAAQADQKSIDAAEVAGLLHDVGYLLLTGGDEAAAEGTSLQMGDGQSRPIESERIDYGADHAVAGAYLAALWGLSEAVVKTIAHHHDPSANPGRPFSVLTAVHIAECIVQGHSGGPQERTATDLVDRDYLAAAGVLDQVTDLARLPIQSADPEQVR